MPEPDADEREEINPSDRFLGDLAHYDEQVIALGRRGQLSLATLWRFQRDLLSQVPRLIDAAVEDAVGEEEEEDPGLTVEQVGSLRDLVAAAGTVVQVGREHDAATPDLVGLAIGRLDRALRAFVAGPLAELVPELAGAVVPAPAPQAVPKVRDDGRSPPPWRPAHAPAESVGPAAPQGAGSEPPSQVGAEPDDGGQP